MTWHIQQKVWHMTQFYLVGNISPEALNDIDLNQIVVFLTHLSMICINFKHI